MPREQFHRQIAALQDGVLEMGSMVERAVDRAIQALMDRDVVLARAVIEEDREINAMAITCKTPASHCSRNRRRWRVTCG